jgi:hypothetical protein
VEPLAVPLENTSWKPALIVVPIARPAESTAWSPPLLTVAPIAVPPE